MSKRTRQELNADITPLIDVVFLLLIFFMTSTVFKKSEMALLLNLPKTENASSTDSSNVKTITIELAKDSVGYSGSKIDISSLDGELAKVTDKNKPIDLRVDKDVPYSRLVKVLDILKKYNLSNLSLITEK